ncbi:MAG: hypothetical protein WCI20_07485 [bacterium]
MTQKSFERKKEERSALWIESLVKLARDRGNSDAVSKRAVQLSHQLNISPWIALAIAERLVTLKEAQLLDRVGRCKELQSAILDRHRTIDELKFLMPYAAHFLAVELLDSHASMKWDARDVVRILEGLLGTEKKTGDDEISFRVRLLPLEFYASAVERILAIMRRTRCDVGMALDVDAGRTGEQFASDYMRQKRNLEIDERRSGGLGRNRTSTVFSVQRARL